MKNRIHAVLFDLDGVIVYTDSYHYKAWKRLADGEGWKFDEELNHKLRGVSRMESLTIILEHNGIDLPEEKRQELAELKNSFYVESLKKIGKKDLVPGALQFVEGCRNEELATAVCSSSKNAQLIIDRLGIGELFDTTVTGWDIINTKPDPEIFLLAAEHLQVSPKLCAVFEDAESGVKAAQAAGMLAVGFGDKEILKEADMVIESLEEITVEDILGDEKI
jgi:beta-phosphoglucomutase